MVDAYEYYYGDHRCEGEELLREYCKMKTHLKSRLSNNTRLKERLTLILNQHPKSPFPQSFWLVNSCEDKNQDLCNNKESKY